MPRTIRQSLNHEVFAVEEGLRLGKPQDMLIDPEKHEVALLVLVFKGLPQTATVISRKDVGSFKEDTLPISGMSAVHLAYQVKGSVPLLEQGLHFQNRDVITSEGHNFGRIVDVLLDDDGKVIEYRVAKGWLRRMLHITKVVLPTQLLTAGEHVAVVDAAEMESSDSDDANAEEKVGT